MLTFWGEHKKFQTECTRAQGFKGSPVSLAYAQSLSASTGLLQSACFHGMPRNKQAYLVWSPFPLELLPDLSAKALACLICLEISKDIWCDHLSLLSHCLVKVLVIDLHQLIYGH